MDNTFSQRCINIPLTSDIIWGVCGFKDFLWLWWGWVWCVNLHSNVLNRGPAEVTTQVNIPENKGHWSNVVLMLGKRRRRWANIKTALVQHILWLYQRGKYIVYYLTLYHAELFLCESWKLKGFFQFEIIIYFLVNSAFRFIWIPMLWVYGN